MQSRKSIVLLFVCANLFCQESAFDNAVQQIYINKPYLKTNTQVLSKDMKKIKPIPIYEIIDAAACIYASAHMYYLYRQIDRSPDIIKMLNNPLLFYFFPEWQKFNNQSIFLLSCLDITCRTLIYKSVAKMVALCATGDVSDLIEGVIVRCKRLLSLLLIL